MRYRTLLGLVLLAWILLPFAPGEAAPADPEKVADEVIAALDGGDDEALAALVRSDKGGGWGVTDILVGRGRLDAARAYMKLAVGGESEAMARYVEGAAQTAETAAARGRAPQVLGLVRKQAWDEALELLEAAPAGPPSIPRIMLEKLKSHVLKAQKQGGASVDALHAAAETSRVLGCGVQAMGLYYQAGRAALGLHDLARTERSWKGALVVSRSKGAAGAPYVAEIASRLANVVDERGRHREGLALNREALAMYRKMGNRQAEAAILSNTGVQLVYLGALGEAETALKAAHALQVEIGDAKSAATTLGSLGTVADMKGDTDGALAIHAESLAAKKALGLLPHAARTITSMGQIRWRRGEYDAALTRYEEALALHKQLGNKPGVGFVLGRQAEAHLELGDHKRADKLLAQAQALFEETGSDGERMHVLRARARLRGRDSAFDEALSLMAVVVAHYTETNNSNLLCGALQQRSGIECDAGRFEPAAASASRALDLGIELKTDVLQAYAHLSLANAFAGTGKVEESARHLKLARAKAQTIDDENFGLALNDTAIEIAHRAGRHADAVTAALLAADALQRSYRQLADDEQAGARERWARGLTRGVLSAAKLGRADDAFQLIELNRAGALRRALGGTDRVYGALLDPALRAEEAEARAQETSAVDRLRAARGGDLSAKQLKALEGELRAARERLHDLDRRVQRGAASARDVTAPTLPTLAEVQKDMAADEAHVLYSMAGEAAVAVVVTKKTKRVVELGPSAILRDLCEDLLVDYEGTIDRERLIELVQLVVMPLRLKNTLRRVRVSPSGPLGYVPFSLLFPGHEVVLVPSAATYALLAEPSAKGTARVLALGDPLYAEKGEASVLRGARAGRSLTRLPATKAEAEAIGDDVLLGAGATEAALRKTLGTQAHWRAVHLACHGLVDPERPMFCSLALTPGDGDDGFLTVLEVMRLKVPADLVVLSACETGRGRVVAGEGILGLTRAFMLAGAPRVLVSLWQVDDEATRMLMEHFYTVWKAGSVGPAEALVKAQNHVRTYKQPGKAGGASKQPYKDPRFWAGWALWGLR